MSYSNGAMLSSCRSAFALPVCREFCFMLSCPLSNQPSRCTRTDLAFEDAPVKIDHGILTVILGMEVWRSVIVEVHANDDSEECGDDRQ
jgi:hypothetical protein